MVIIILKYVKSLEAINSLLEDHIKFLDNNYKQSKFIFSGRLNPRTGGVILANVAGIDEARQIVKDDPFNTNHVAEYQFLEFIPSKYDTRFSCFVE